MPFSAFFARLVPSRRVIASGSALVVVAGGLAAVTEPSAHARGTRPSYVTVATVDQDSTMAVDAAGTRVAYTNSTASGRQAYLYDESTGVSTLLTAAAGGTPATGDSDSVAIDADGSDVAFTSAATDLDASGAELVSGTPQAYVAHVAADGTVTLTRLPLPAGATSGASSIAISADGSRVAFAGNAGDSGTGSAYVDDWQTAGATPRPVDVTPSADSTRTVVDQLTLSGDGSTLAAVVDDGTATVADGARVVLASLDGSGAGTATTMPDTEADRGTPVALDGNGTRVLVAPASSAPSSPPSGWVPPDYLVSWQWRQSGSAPQHVGINGYSIVGRPSLSSDGELVGYSLKYDDQDGYLVDVGQFPDFTYPYVGISVDDSDYDSPTTGYGSSPALARSLPMLSADGLHVVFRSNSTDLPNPPASGKTTLYLATLDDSQAPTFGSRTVSAEDIENDSVELSLPEASDDLFVTGTTLADNGTPVADYDGSDDFTVSGLTPGSKHVFTYTARDESGHTTSQSVTAWTGADPVAGSFDSSEVSTLPAGTTGVGIQVDGDAANPVISGDGRYVAYVGAVIAGYDSNGDPVAADGTSLGDGGPLPGDQVFLTDTLTGKTTLVTHQSGGTAPAGDPEPTSVTISADGRYLAYAATGTDLAPGVTGADPHAYVYDRTTDSSVAVPTDYPIDSPASSSGPSRLAATAAPMAIGPSGEPVVPMLALSADGSRLVALTYNPDGYLERYAQIVDWQGGGSTSIPFEMVGFSGLALSPDGGTLAVSGGNGDGDQTEIFDVANQTTLADFDFVTAAPLGFDADGSHLLLDGSDPFGGSPLTLEWSASEPNALVDFGGPEATSFAADGTHVAQSGWDDNTGAPVVYLDTLGGVPQQVGDGGQPVLDADGSSIAYVGEIDTATTWHDSLLVAHAHDTTAPTWPADAAVTVSQATTTSVHLAWPAAADDNAVASYVLTQDGTTIATLGANTLGHDVTGLAAGTTYTFAVVAKDAAGNTSDALTVAASTLSAGVTPGQDPLLVKADQGGVATLSWDAAGSAISGYRVMRDDGTGFTAVADVPADKTGYTDSGLLASTAYTYRVDLLDPTGTAGPWTKTASVTTPALVISKASVTVPYLPDTPDGTNIAALGGSVELRVVGEPNRQADARIAYTLPDDGSGVPQYGSAVAALTEDPAHPGSYTGSWTIPEGAAVLDSVTGELSDGGAAHTVSTAAPGLPVQVSGAVAVTVIAPPAGSLAGSTLDVDGNYVDVDGPGTYTVPIAAGTGYAIRMDTKTEQDVAAATVDVTAGWTTSVQITPQLHASLVVTIVKADNPRFCSSAVTVTVADDAGTQLGQQQTTCYQRTVTFDDLPVGDHVTVTSTLREPTDPVRFTAQGSLTLVEGENDLTVTHAALPSATISGTVTTDDGVNAPHPQSDATVTVTEHVDGRDWSYPATTDDNGNYSLGVLAGSVTVKVSYGGDGLFPDTAVLDVGDGASITHDVRLVRGTLTVHVTPADGVAAGGFTVTESFGYGVDQRVVVPDGQTDATLTAVQDRPLTITVDVNDRTKPIVLHYSQSLTPQDPTIDVTITEQLLPTSTLTGTVTANGTAVPGMAVQLSERVDNRAWTFTGVTDSSGTYTIAAIAGDGTVGVLAPSPSGYGLPAGHSVTLPADGSAQSDFALPRFTTRTVHLNLITTDFGSSPSPQTLDWTTNIHFGTALYDASGRSYPVGPTTTVPSDAPSPLKFCASGLQAGMPTGCVTQAFDDDQSDITLTLRLDQAAGLTGTVLGPDGTPYTGTWTFAGEPLDDTARANGGYFSAFGDSSTLHQGLPAAGKWRVHINAANGNSAWADVTVSAGQTLDLGDLLLSGVSYVSGDSSVVATPDTIEPGQLLQVRAEFTATRNVPGAGIRLGIPDGTSFAAGSVTVDGTPVDASAVDSAVTVPLGDLASGAHHVVRYAVRVGDSTTVASLSAPVWLVDAGGTLHAVGSATVPLIAVSLTAPEHATAATFTVNGTAPAGNTVTVVDGHGDTVGTGSAGPGGLWQAQVTLPDGHPGQTYQLTAESDYQGQQLTDSADVIFDPDYLLPTSIAVGQPDGRFHSYNPANGVAYFTLVYRPSLPVRVIAQFTDTSRIENPIAWVGVNWAPMTCDATSCTADVPIADEFAGGSGVDVDYKVKPILAPAPAPTQQQELSSLPGPFAGSQSTTSSTSYDYATDQSGAGSGQALVNAAHSTGTVAIPGSGVNMDYDVSVAESAQPVGDPVDVAGGSLYASHSQSKSGDGSVSMHLTLYVPADEIAAANGSVRTALRTLGMSRLAAMTPDSTVTKALGVVLDIGLNLLQGAEGLITSGAQTAWGLIKSFYTPPSKYYDQLHDLQDQIYAATCLTPEQKKLLLDEVEVAGVQVTLIYAMQALAPVPLFLSGIGETSTVALATLKIGLDEVLQGLINYAVSNAVSATFGDWMQGEVDDTRADVEKVLRDSRCKPPPPRNCPPGMTCPAPGPGATITPIIDPSGIVTDATTGQPLDGVTATIETAPSKDGPWTTWNAADYGQTNPQLTDATGAFGWDTPIGWYRVKFTKDRYVTGYSQVVHVLPEWTGLNVALQRKTVKLGVTVQPDQPVYGQPVTLAVSTTPAEPGTTVTVSEDGTQLGSGVLDANGTTSITVSGLHAGTHQLTVSYPGDAEDFASSTTVPVTIARAATRVTVDRITSLGALLDFLFHRRVTAHLVRADDGTPIAGEQVTLSTRLGDFCTATTDPSGTITCTVPLRMFGQVLAGRAQANFAGTTDYLPSDYGVEHRSRPHGRE